MGTHYFDIPPETVSSSDLIIKKIIEEHLKEYPLRINDCEALNKMINDQLKAHRNNIDVLIKSKEESLRDTVKNVCDLFEERIKKLENMVGKTYENNTR